jgi:hypothetical protein
MIKDFIIALLAAALIQPHWTNVNTTFDTVTIYVITTGILFVTIADMDEWIKKKKP